MITTAQRLKVIEAQRHKAQGYVGSAMYSTAMFSEFIHNIC